MKQVDGRKSGRQAPVLGGLVLGAFPEIWPRFGRGTRFAFLAFL